MFFSVMKYVFNMFFLLITVLCLFSSLLLPHNPKSLHWRSFLLRRMPWRGPHRRGWWCPWKGMLKRRSRRTGKRHQPSHRLTLLPGSGPRNKLILCYHVWPSHIYVSRPLLQETQSVQNGHAYCLRRQTWYSSSTRTVFDLSHDCPRVWVCFILFHIH